MSLPDGFASSCRGCGAAIHPESQKCGSCAQGYAAGSESRQRLNVHRARMVRALERLRAAVAFRVATSLTQRHIPKLVLLLLGGVLVSLAATMVVTVVGVLKHEELGGLAYVVIGAAILLAVGGVIGTVVSALATARVLAGRADRMARRCVRDWAATDSLYCESCNGRFETVNYAEGIRVPCPWCDALVAAESEQDLDPSIAVARETAMRHKQELGPKAYRHLMRKLGRRPLRTLRVPLPGFRAHAGLITGEPEGVSMWSSLEYIDSEPTLRLEVDSPTRFDGVWFVRPAVESDLRQAGDLWGIELPRKRADSPIPEWSAYAQAGDRVPRGAQIEGLLESLGPRDAVLFDAGGISVWRRSGNFVALFRPWTLLRDVVQNVLGVVKVVSEPRTGPKAGQEGVGTGGMDAGPRRIGNETTVRERGRG